MHKKFARRLAQIFMAKKKAAGSATAAAWWDDRFRNLPKSEIDQVRTEVMKLR